MTAASLTAAAPVARIPTIPSLDSTVLGGGLVPGAVYLLAGGKGAGKSSLAMAACDGVARNGRKALYSSGEEAAVRVGDIARRMRVTNPAVLVAGEACDIDAVLHQCDEVTPTLLVVDSLQVMTTEACDGAEGTSAQAEAVINRLQSYCMKRGMAAFVMNHMQKGGGDLAGPEVVGHLVDAVLFLDRDPDDEDPALRMLHAPEKNRTASTEHVAWFEMERDGFLKPIRRKSKLELE